VQLQGPHESLLGTLSLQTRSQGCTPRELLLGLGGGAQPHGTPGQAGGGNPPHPEPNSQQEGKPAASQAPGKATSCREGQAPGWATGCTRNLLPGRFLPSGTSKIPGFFSAIGAWRTQALRLGQGAMTVAFRARVRKHPRIPTDLQPSQGRGWASWMQQGRTGSQVAPKPHHECRKAIPSAQTGSRQLWSFQAFYSQECRWPVN